MKREYKVRTFVLKDSSTCKETDKDIENYLNSLDDGFVNRIFFHDVGECTIISSKRQKRDD